MKTQTEFILARFESVEDAASKTGESKTSWYNWRRTGFIPQTKHLSIIQNAEKSGVEIPPADFVCHLVEQLLSHNRRKV